MKNITKRFKAYPVNVYFCLREYQYYLSTKPQDHDNELEFCFEAVIALDCDPKEVIHKEATMQVHSLIKDMKTDYASPFFMDEDDAFYWVGTGNSDRVCGRTMKATVLDLDGAAMRDEIIEVERPEKVQHVLYRFDINSLPKKPH